MSEKHWFYFPRQPSISTSFSAGMGFHPSHPCWDFVLLDLMQALCMLSQLLGVHVRSGTILSRIYCSNFTVISRFHWLLQYIHSSFVMILELWGGEKCNTRILFRTKHFTVSYSLCAILCVNHHPLQNKVCPLRGEKVSHPEPERRWQWIINKKYNHVMFYKTWLFCLEP